MVSKGTKVWLSDKVDYLELKTTLAAINEALNHRRETLYYLYSFQMLEKYRREIENLENMKEKIINTLAKYENHDKMNLKR